MIFEDPGETWSEFVFKVTIIIKIQLEVKIKVDGRKEVKRYFYIKLIGLDNLKLNQQFKVMSSQRSSHQVKDKILEVKVNF